MMEPPALLPPPPLLRQSMEAGRKSRISRPSPVRRMMEPPVLLPPLPLLGQMMGFRGRYSLSIPATAFLSKPPWSIRMGTHGTRSALPTQTTGRGKLLLRNRLSQVRASSDCLLSPSATTYLVHQGQAQFIMPLTTPSFMAPLFPSKLVSTIKWNGPSSTAVSHRLGSKPDISLVKKSNTKSSADHTN